MNTYKQISIIIPNLHSSIINQTIDSLLNQETNYPYEIIVVGQDKYEFVEKYSDSRIKFIKTENPTQPAIAWNLGIYSAKGDYIFFIDADCIASARWVEGYINNYPGTSWKVIIASGVGLIKTNYWTRVDNISSLYKYLVHIQNGKKDHLPLLDLIYQKSSIDINKAV